MKPVLNIADLLVRTWDLTTKARYNNARDAVIDNLNHNILAGGGCLAGIAARLAQPYLALLANGLEQRLVQPQRPVYTPRYNNNQNMNMSEEEQLARAIALSQQSASTVQDNDADFNRAVQLSLQNNRPSRNTVGAELSEEEQLAIALQLSQQSANVDFDCDDEDLARALERSKYYY